MKMGWGVPPATLRLGRDDVHVWRASLDEPASQIDGFLRTLAPDERTRAERFYFPRDRERFRRSDSPAAPARRGCRRC